MADVLGDLGEKAIVNRIERFELRADGRIATVTLQRPDLVIERSILIRVLAEHAQAAGAEIVFGRQLIQVAPNGHGLAFVVEPGEGGRTEEWWAPTLVGADGAFSTVARTVGWPQPTTVPLLQATVRLPGDLSPDTTRVWFSPEDTPYFYWLIPESPTRGVLGLIGEEGRETRRCLERFLARQRLEPIELQAARIPSYAGWIDNHRRVGHGDVYLVGDAAAQVKATTVGGIVTGFRGAASVASAILSGGASRELRALRRELDRPGAAPLHPRRLHEAPRCARSIRAAPARRLQPGRDRTAPLASVCSPTAVPASGSARLPGGNLCSGEGVLKRRWRRAVITLVVFGLLLVAVMPSGMSALGRWLVVTDPIDKASAIVVLVGAMPARAMEAARLYEQGWAPEVWLTRENRASRDAVLLHLGIRPPHDHEYSWEILVRLGVPSSVIRVLDPPILNTMQEVDLLARELRSAGGQRVILVTSKAHTRRVRATWWARVGDSPAAIVRSATQDGYNPERWWRRTGDVFAVSREALGLVNVWTGFPVQPDVR
jgi:uncharacterized SAM-binding protein YcdF (DUF218 family)